MSKDRPILFNGAMIRAILEGRKTQTRRLVKPRRGYPIDFIGGHGSWDDPASWGFDDLNGDWWTLTGEEEGTFKIPCPQGDIGDQLWVRETFQGPIVPPQLAEDYYKHPEKYETPKYCFYKADEGPAAPEFMALDDEIVRRWRPSVHMPRWASRITLEITNVRVERLNDISEVDAKTEGWIEFSLTAKGSFHSLWEAINGKGTWDLNPWVWVIEFKVIRPGVKDE